ncbi:MAG TPA: polysaccharide deacetylase family protein [Candidatus Paceibacterota bacterium]
MKSKYKIAVVVGIFLSILIGAQVSYAAEGPNLISNPSVEAGTVSYPTDWLKKDLSGVRGIFLYPVPGYDDARALKLNLYQDTSDGEGWYFKDVSVTPGETYIYRDVYVSNVPTWVRVTFTYKNGSRRSQPSVKFPRRYAWTPMELEIQVPADAIKVTVLHLLKNRGTLTTDMFSLRQVTDIETPVTAPIISSFSATPSSIAIGNSSTLSWQVTNASSISIDQSIGPVSALGSRLVTPSANTSYTLTASNSGGSVSQTVTISVTNEPPPPPPPTPVPPTLNSFSASPSSITVGGNSTLNWDISNATSILIDQGIGAVAAQGSTVVSPTQTKNYTITASNDAGTVTRSATITVTPAPVLPVINSFGALPTVITAGESSTLSWSVSNADTIAINNGVGPVVPSGTANVSPSSSVTYTLTATNGVGSVTASASVTVNPVVPPPPPPPPSGSNLIPNPSFEDAAGVDPIYWHRGNWGTNNVTFTYPVTGQSGSKAAEITISSISSGDAKWYHDNVNIEPNTSYIFKDFYKGTTDSNVTIRYTHTNGSESYVWLGTVSPSSLWQEFMRTFTTPADVASLTFFHVISSVGTLTVDNYSLVKGNAPTGTNLFDRGYVTLAFDDGWTSQYDNVLPMLAAAGLKASFFIITNEIAEADQTPGYIYMNSTQLTTVQSQGHEVSAHTKTHTSLTSLSSTAARTEIEGSRSALLSIGMTPVETFVYPYGDYSSAVIQLVQNAGFIGARSVETGYNTKTTNKYALQSQNLVISTTLNEVKTWIDEANRTKTWVILTIHEVNNSNNEYNTPPSVMQGIVNYLGSTNTSVITMREGLLLMQ